MGLFRRKIIEVQLKKCPVCGITVFNPNERFCSPNCEWKFSQAVFQDDDTEIERKKWFENSW